LTHDLIFIATRLLFSLPILSYPLFGGILAVVIDYFDFEILKFINNGDLSMYQSLDKSMDMLYLSLEAYVSLRWVNKLAKYTSLGLFFYRLIGYVLYGVFQAPWILLLFPNVFEWFFLYCLVYKKFLKKDPIQTKWQLVRVLIFLTIPKLAHEYLLHINTIHPWWKVPLLLIHKS
jgi:hypothetical protein